MGWALFADDDFLWLGDVAELFAKADDRYAVMCVKHNYTPQVNVKLAGRKQEPYPRKNWSSMVLFNCGQEANLNLDLATINNKAGSFLHRFSWIEDEGLIGDLDFSWNFLAEWYTPEESRLPKAIHFTEGGPWFPDYRNTDYAKEWFEYLKMYEATLKSLDFSALMSVLFKKGMKLSVDMTTLTVRGAGRLRMSHLLKMMLRGCAATRPLNRDIRVLRWCLNPKP